MSISPVQSDELMSFEIFKWMLTYFVITYVTVRPSRDEQTTRSERKTRGIDRVAMAKDGKTSACGSMLLAAQIDR